MPAAALLLLGGTELFLRQHYGLGTPVLMMSDRKTEYRAVPNQHVVRLGNHVDYNAYSMRSEDFPKAKSDPREIRVLVIGDSVINGGNQTDQSQLATSLLEKTLHEKLGRPVIVANISAGSWGPQNELAYLERFGSFDADQIVIVVSDHDARDEIGDLPADDRITSRQYWLALAEAFDRTFPTVRGSSASDPMPTVGDAEPCLTAFDAMLRYAELQTGRRAIVVFHPERQQVDAAVEPKGHKEFRAICEKHGIAPIELRHAYRQAFDAGRDPYRDYIHPNASGQKAMADAIEPALESVFLTPPQPTTHATTEPS